MKDYNATKYWVNEIARLSEIADQQIEFKKGRISDYKEQIKELPEEETDFEKEQIEELQEEIKALEWCINQINAPFKIKK